jgi:hypothetical protein
MFHFGPKIVFIHAYYWVLLLPNIGCHCCKWVMVAQKKEPQLLSNNKHQTFHEYRDTRVNYSIRHL